MTRFTANVSGKPIPISSSQVAQIQASFICGNESDIIGISDSVCVVHMWADRLDILLHYNLCVIENVDHRYIHLGFNKGSP